MKTLLGSGSHLVHSLIALTISKSKEDCSDIVCDFIARSEIIESIDASGGTLTSNHFDFLVDALARTETLRSLFFTWNKSNMQEEKLIEALFQNTSLTILEPVAHSLIPISGIIKSKIQNILERNRLMQTSLFSRLLPMIQ